MALSLRPGRASITAPERNGELLLLVAAVVFVIVAFEALEGAAFALPDPARRIVTQFALVAAAGHVGLRLVAPRASGVPYSVAMMLSAVGLVFVIRLAPEVANDQVNWISVGVVLMVATAALAPVVPRLRELKYTAALAAAILLAVTGIFGTTINGARLWLTIGGQTIQSTEVIKVLLVVFLAGYLAVAAPILASPRIRFAGRTYSALPYLIPLAVTWAVTLLALAWLRDLGAIALLLLLAVAALYIATGRLRFVYGGFALLAITGVLGYYAFSHAQARIDIWLDPFSDPGGTGYQTTQSLYAFEAGGITGEGLGRGSPDVIPASQTDYIFASVGEELGMAGALAVVLLYAIFVIAGLRIASVAHDSYESLLAALVAVLVGIQASVIIAGNLRIIPTTGITLPFVSYGGSSLVVNFVLLGLLLAISNRGRESR